MTSWTCALTVGVIGVLLRLAYQEALFFKARAVPLAVRYAMHSPTTAAIAATCHLCTQVRVDVELPALVQSVYIDMARRDKADQRHGHTVITALPCGARLPFAARVAQRDDGGAAADNAVLHGVLATLPCPGAASTVRLAYGSCLSVVFGGLRLDAVFRWLESLSLDALLILGDVVYSDTPSLGLDDDRNAHRFYQRLFSVPEVASALRHMSLYTALDDHEIENNYAGGPDTPLYREKVALWLSYVGLQNPPSWYEGPNAHGFGLRFGGIDLAVADTRTWRGQRDGLLGAPQRRVLHDWVRNASDAVAASRAASRPPRHVPLLASPSVVMPIHFKRGREGWWDHPGEFQQIVNLWRAQGDASDLPLTFLSGDIHTAELTASRVAGRRTLLEFVSSPIMSFPLLARFAQPSSIVNRTEPDLVNEEVDFFHAELGRSFHISVVEVSTDGDGFVTSAKILLYSWSWFSEPALVHTLHLF